MKIARMRFTSRICCIYHMIVSASAARLTHALTIVDIASRYKEAEPLTDKKCDEVANALSRVYKRGPLTWPRLLQVDPGREFMGAVNRLLAKQCASGARSRGPSSRSGNRRTYDSRGPGTQASSLICVHYYR